MRNHTLVIFVSITENGWLAPLGPNKREIKESEESWKYTFRLAIRDIFTQAYIAREKYTKDI